jgi:hypothetical protein
MRKLPKYSLGQIFRQLIQFLFFPNFPSQSRENGIGNRFLTRDLPLESGLGSFEHCS